MKRYLQYNNFVIDSHDSLQSITQTIDTKNTIEDYSFAHGGYAPFKQRQPLLSAPNISMTLILNTNRINCELRDQYFDYVKYNLLQQGQRLWAKEGRNVLWAIAYISSFSEPYLTDTSRYEIDVNFVLPEGYWHKADVKKVFVKPYNPCAIDECYDFDIPMDTCCIDCLICLPVNSCPICSCDCDFLEKEYALCNFDVSKLDECINNYRLVYNCEAGKRLWGEKEMWGNRICKEDACSEIIAGNFKSNTTLDTTGTITLVGEFNNPLITINDNTLRLEGSYSGTLTIHPNFDIWYITDPCCEPSLVPIENIKITDNNTLGFVIKKGHNGVMVRTGECNTMACVYIKVDERTI